MTRHYNYSQSTTCFSCHTYTY